MNSISSCRGGAPPARQRLLRGQQPVEPQVAGVGQAVGEVGDDAGFEVARGHGRWRRSDRSERRSIATPRRAGDARGRSANVARAIDASMRALLPSAAMTAARAAPRRPRRARASASPAAATARRAARDDRARRCRLPKLPIAAQCGTLEVPENRDQPGGRKITLAVAVLPANTLHPRADPLFILAGGPGPGRELPRAVRRALTGVRKDRDIVLVDQRGTGRSSPLVCAAFKPDDSLEAALELDPRAEGGRLRAGARRAGRRRRAVHDGRVGRRPRCGARGARLRQDQPVGRLVRNARGAGIPAPPSGPRAQRRARRRRAAVDEDHARRLAVARGRARRACSTRARSRRPARAAHPDLARDARRDPRPARARTGATSR